MKNKQDTDSLASEVAELKEIIKYQQTIIKNYQHKLDHQALNHFLSANHSPYALLYFLLYAYVTTMKTPLTILRGHIQMLRKRIIDLDPTNAFLLAEEFNLFEENTTSICEILSAVDSLSSFVPSSLVETQFSPILEQFREKNGKLLRETGITLTCHCPDYISASVNPLLIDLLLFHLFLTPADKSAGGTIMLSVVEGEKACLISASTSGIDLPIPADGVAQASIPDGPGSPLSPVIRYNLCSWIIEELKGKMEIRSSNDTEATILIELPKP